MNEAEISVKILSYYGAGFLVTLVLLITCSAISSIKEYRYFVYGDAYTAWAKRRKEDSLEEFRKRLPSVVFLSFFWFLVWIVLPLMGMYSLLEKFCMFVVKRLMK